MSDWFDGAGGSDSAVDVPALLDSDAGQRIGNLVAAGALVSLGLTRDAGALGITVTVDGRWRREYFRNCDDMLVWMDGAVSAVTEAMASQVASSAPRKRLRSLRDR